ncbi:MAG: type pilus assembly PilZ [Myxococcaceae bacterium]|nr:type pilus assembly PilZ [Myxococcaceae bacterium]
MSRNVASGEPVRLKVTYKTPVALISEYTRSVGKGGVSIASRKVAPVGTRFIFELEAKGVPELVEVHGEVVAVAPQPGGMFLLQIRYQQSESREGLDALLRRIFEAQKYEKVRKHARIPLQVRATEDKASSVEYLLRDISFGGLGLEIEALEVPRWVKIQEPVFLELTLSLGVLALHGEIVWVMRPPKERTTLMNPGFGVSFGKLRPDTTARLQQILTFRGLPPPPWKATISFGMNAVSRMP